MSPNPDFLSSIRVGDDLEFTRYQKPGKNKPNKLKVVGSVVFIVPPNCSNVRGELEKITGKKQFTFGFDDKLEYGHTTYVVAVQGKRKPKYYRPPIHTITRVLRPVRQPNLFDAPPIPPTLPPVTDPAVDQALEQLLKKGRERKFTNTSKCGCGMAPHDSGNSGKDMFGLHDAIADLKDAMTPGPNPMQKAERLAHSLTGHKFTIVQSLADPGKAMVMVDGVGVGCRIIGGVSGDFRYNTIEML